VNLTIRPMAEDDLDRVLDIENASFHSPWRRSFFRADMTRPDGLCVVAESSEHGLLGYLVAWGRDEVHLANVAVAEEWRGQGIGRQLMARVMSWAAGQGAASLYLEVRMSNSGARKFYADLGFVPTYLRKGYYENGEDAVVMEKDVPQGAERLWPDA
jgi:ribosomal-protein-alanine N-acetyltransferase